MPKEHRDDQIAVCLLGNMNIRIKTDFIAHYLLSRMKASFLSGQKAMEQGKRNPGLVKEVTRLSSFPNTATSLQEGSVFIKSMIIRPTFPNTATSLQKTTIARGCKFDLGTDCVLIDGRSWSDGSGSGTNWYIVGFGGCKIMIMAMATWIPIMIVIVIMIIIMTMPTSIPMHKSTIVGSRDKLQRIGAEQLQ